MAQPTAILDALDLDARSETPLYRQVYDYVRAAILDGRLPAGLRLPPSRTLAKELGVGRNTIVLAYEQLIAEGYLEPRVGAGTHVAEIPPDLLLEAGPAEKVPDGAAADGAAADGAAADGTGSDGTAPERSLSETGKRAAMIKRATPFFEKGTARAFQHGLPSLEAFPQQAWARAMARRARQTQSRLFDYQLGAGFPALREAIAAYLGAARGVNCRPDNVIVTSGAQAGLDLATRMLVDPGDTVWLEDPGYLGARGAFLAAGAEIVPVPVDDQGLNPDAAPPGKADPRLIYLTPSHQFPLGVTMTLQRRLEVLQRARAAGAWVLEDDYDSEFRYAGRPIGALQGLDSSGGVIYMGTFAKTLFPALRVGYLVVPDRLVDAFEQAIRITGQSPTAVIQATLADFMEEGHFAAHIRRMRAIYAERQQLLIETLERAFGNRLVPMRPDGGMQVSALMAPEADDAKAAKAAAARDVHTTALSSYFVGPPAKRGLYLGYAAVPEKRIEAGVARLADALSTMGP